MVLTLTILGILAIVLLTAISAFFSSSELAAFSVASHRIETLVAEGRPSADALATLRAEPSRFLVTVLVSNNVANIAAASVATAILVQFVSAGQAATGATVVTSFFVIVFGEIAPKSYAVANAERHALRIARPVLFAQRVLRPILFVFEFATSLVNRFTGGQGEFDSYVSREEIETIVLSGERSGVLDTDEGTMIRSVLDLEKTRVRSVMVPRTEMVAVHRDDSLDSMIETCWRGHVTRAPVYGDTRDEIYGIADLRDLLRARNESNAIETALSEPVFVPGTKPVDELLTEMQVGGHRMAIVVDEFGTVTGLATLEDVVEEVVGELFGRDETDPVRLVEPGTAVVHGWCTVEYCNERLGTTLQTDGPFETVAGLISNHLGKVASEGDRVEFSGVTLVVLDATQRRIRRVRVDYTPPNHPEDERKEEPS